MQRSITTKIPACRAFSAARSSITSSCIQIAGIFIERMLVADGFGAPVFTDFAGKPGARVFTPRLTGEGLAPLAEVLGEHCCRHTLVWQMR